jgi:hypothetical protein
VANGDAEGLANAMPAVRDDATIVGEEPQLLSDALSDALS